MWSNVSPRLVGQLVVVEPLGDAHEPGLFEAAPTARDLEVVAVQPSR
jgi:hypothetical protein